MADDTSLMDPYGYFALQRKLEPYLTEGAPLQGINQQLQYYATNMNGYGAPGVDVNSWDPASWLVNAGYGQYLRNLNSGNYYAANGAAGLPLNSDAQAMLDAARNQTQQSIADDQRNNFDTFANNVQSVIGGMGGLPAAPAPAAAAPASTSAAAAAAPAPAAAAAAPAASSASSSSSIPFVFDFGGLQSPLFDPKDPAQWRGYREYARQATRGIMKMPYVFGGNPNNLNYFDYGAPGKSPNDIFGDFYKGKFK